MIPFDDNNLSDENGKLKVIAPTGELYGDLNGTRLKAKMKSAELDLEIKHYGDVILNGGTGSFPLLFTKVNYQYSIPFSDMKGKLIIEGKEYEVDGNCWLDRQFSPVADGLNAWDESLLGSSKWAWVKQLVYGKSLIIMIIEIFSHQSFMPMVRKLLQVKINY